LFTTYCRIQNADSFMFWIAMSSPIAMTELPIQGSITDVS